jgi:hypothetical protein
MGMDGAQIVEFARAFRNNMTLKRLILRGREFPTWTFAEALPKDHSLKSIVFYGYFPDGGYAVNIINTL